MGTYIENEYIKDYISSPMILYNNHYEWWGYGNIGN